MRGAAATNRQTEKPQTLRDFRWATGQSRQDLYLSSCPNQTSILDQLIGVRSDDWPERRVVGGLELGLLQKNPVDSAIGPTFLDGANPLPAATY